MDNARISDLTLLSSIANDDLFIIEDVSEGGVETAKKITTGQFKTFLAIPNITVVQTTGASVTSIMSQKAVTDTYTNATTAIGNIFNDLDTHVENTVAHTSSSEKAAWNAKSNFSGNYGDLANKPNIINNLTNTTTGQILDSSQGPVITGLIGANTTAIGTITAKIPNNASSTNQLADKAFVNSSLNALAANRCTYNAAGSPWPDAATLFGATTFYNSGQPYVPKKSDYAIVLVDESAPAPFTNGQTRYEFGGTTWDFAYGINARPFTAAEVAAIESGVSSSVVAQVTTNKNNITTINTSLTSKQNVSPDDNVSYALKNGGLVPVTSLANNLTTVSAGKALDAAQGPAITTLISALASRVTALETALATLTTNVNSKITGVDIAKNVFLTRAEYETLVTNSQIEADTAYDIIEV